MYTFQSYDIRVCSNICIFYILYLHHLINAMFLGCVIIIYLYHITQWFSACSPLTSSISSTWELVRNSNLGPRPAESETLGEVQQSLFPQDPPGSCRL